MELKILKESKEETEIEFDNLTLAELLRVYLNKDTGVIFVAWKREHPTKNPVLKVQTKNKTPKKAVNDAISSITRELDKIEGDFNKLK